MEQKQIHKLMNLPLTDSGNAERLRILFGRSWKYLPQYRTWMHWEKHGWKGRKTESVWWAAAKAFRQLAVEIYRLPMPEDELEQHRRVRIIAWLTRSQINYHTMLAVRYFKEMSLEVAA